MRSSVLKQVMSTEDKYVAKLKEHKIELEKCQQDHQLESCFNCSELLNCELRRNYTKAVYESMSKGETGGFEF